MKYYVLEIIEDVEPELHGPFESEEEQCEVAKTLRKKDPCMENGIFPAEITDSGTLSVGVYSGAFFLGNNEQ